jgi:hypothetical protein
LDVGADLYGGSRLSSGYQFHDDRNIATFGHLDRHCGRTRRPGGTPLFRHAASGIEDGQQRRERKSRGAKASKCFHILPLISVLDGEIERLRGMFSRAGTMFDGEKRESEVTRLFSKVATLELAEET